MSDTHKRNDNFLAISILISAILISGSVIYSFGMKNNSLTGTETLSEKPLGTVEDFEIDDNVVLGDPNAPLTIFVFSDYQCPFCEKFYQGAELQIRENYIKTGKVNMVYKDLAFLGQESVSAAQAAVCAKDQGKYWDYHDAIFEIEGQEAKKVGNSENTGNLNRDTFEKIAINLGMNVDEFLLCFDSEKYASSVEKDLSEAKAVFSQISTPTIIIGSKVIQGAYPYVAFSQAIDEELKK